MTGFDIPMEKESSRLSWKWLAPLAGVALGTCLLSPFALSCNARSSFTGEECEPTSQGESLRGRRLTIHDPDYLATQGTHAVHQTAVHPTVVHPGPGLVEGAPAHPPTTAIVTDDGPAKVYHTHHYVAHSHVVSPSVVHTSHYVVHQPSHVHTVHHYVARPAASHVHVVTVHGGHHAASYPVDSYPAETYPSGDYPSGDYPAETYPSGDYPAETYPSGDYPENYPSDGSAEYPETYPADGDGAAEYPETYPADGDGSAETYPSDDYPENYPADTDGSDSSIADDGDGSEFTNFDEGDGFGASDFSHVHHFSGHFTADPLKKKL